MLLWTRVTKILSRIGFVMPLLKDYEVHIPRGGKTDALTECIITWQSQEQEFKHEELTQIRSWLL